MMDFCWVLTYLNKSDTFVAETERSTNPYSSLPTSREEYASISSSLLCSLSPCWESQDFWQGFYLLKKTF